MFPLLSPGPHVLTLANLDENAIRDRLRSAMSLDGSTSGGGSAAVESRLATALARAATLPVARAVVVNLDVVRSQGVIVAPSVLLGARSQAFDDRMDHARRVTIYVVTLGAAWDHALDRLCDADEAPAAWFLDQVANARVDEATRELEALIERDQARAGLRRTPRVRAGYRGHPLLALHDALCAAVRADRLGIAVNEVGALSPRKSVSGLVGWEPSA